MAKKEQNEWNEKLAFYDSIIASCPNFERKGKTMPYTSDNGHMFTLFNKAGEIGVRLSKTDGAAFIQKYNSGPYKSYGATMNGYVLIPESLYGNMDLLTSLFNQAHQFVLSLPPK